MQSDLPKDLAEAVTMVSTSLEAGLFDQKHKRFLASLKFEGLKPMPMSIKIYNNLLKSINRIALICTDAGSTALAKHTSPEISNDIFSMNNLISNNNSLSDYDLSIMVSPQPSDYDELNKLHNLLNCPIAIINGKLEDTAVGIGSVARERRKVFLSQWIHSYWLEPLDNAALMRIYPGEWNLYKSENNLYTFLTSFKSKPSSEQIFESLLAN